MPSLLFHSGFYNAPFLFSLALIIILIAAAVYDIKTYTIPHVFSYAIISLFVVKTLWLGINMNYLPWHLLSVVIAFGLGFILFVMNLMGGGDVKLFTALAIWVFPLGLLGLIFCVSLTGVVLSLGIAGFRMANLENDDGETLTFKDKYQHVRKRRIPYGPAIALGTILYLIFSKNLGF